MGVIRSVADRRSWDPARTSRYNADQVVPSSSLLVAPDLDRGDHQYHREDGEEDGGWDDAEEVASEVGADEGADGHYGYELPLCADDREAAVAAVTGEAGDHGGQAHCQCNTSGEFQVCPEEEHHCRDEQFPACHAKQCGDDPDAYSGNDPHACQEPAMEEGRAAVP